MKGNPVQDDRLLSSQLFLAFINYKVVTSQKLFTSRQITVFRRRPEFHELGISYILMPCTNFLRLYRKNKVISIDTNNKSKIFRQKGGKLHVVSLLD